MKFARLSRRHKHRHGRYACLHHNKPPCRCARSSSSKTRFPFDSTIRYSYPFTAFVGAAEPVKLTLSTASLLGFKYTLRRMLKLALEWGRVANVAARTRLLPGENRRHRALTEPEDAAYLKAVQDPTKPTG